MKRSHVLLALIVCAMFSLTLAGLHFVEPPPGAREPLLLLTGSLSSAFGLVVGYWFASSAGSAQKSELMASRGALPPEQHVPPRPMPAPAEPPPA